MNARDEESEGASAFNALAPRFRAVAAIAPPKGYPGAWQAMRNMRVTPGTVVPPTRRGAERS